MLCDVCRERDGVVQVTQDGEGLGDARRTCARSARRHAVSRRTVTMPKHPLSGLSPGVQQQLGGQQARAARCTFCSTDAAGVPELGPPRVHALLRNLRGRACASCCVKIHGNSRHAGSRYDPPAPALRSSASTLATSFGAASPGGRDGAVRARGIDCATRSRDSSDGRSLAACRMVARAGSTPRATTRTSCCPRVFAWHATSKATRSRDGPAMGSVFGSSRRCGRRCHTCLHLRTESAVRVDEMAPTDRLLLHERHLVSKELAGLDVPQGVRSGAALYLSESAGVMINEEDHLRLQALRSGFSVGEALADGACVWIGS